MKLDEFLEEFGTSDKHGEGSRLMINEEHYLLIAGCDSEIGQKVQWEMVRANRDDSEALDAMVNIYAKLVIGWSIDEKLTHKKAVTVIKSRPSLLPEIMSFYQDRGNFTKP